MARMYGKKPVRRAKQSGPGRKNMPEKDYGPYRGYLRVSFDKFFAGYVDAALWSSFDDQGNPLDENFGQRDISSETLRKMGEDVWKFWIDNDELISSDPEQAGQDFWLTRNGHGAGFWDGGWPGDVGKRLTDAAHAYGEFGLYVGDDGKIHGEGG